MWLPVILLRDLGPWSFVVFALPNVIGAAAMGWVIPTADAAERLAREHAGACRLFSVVTYLFQCFVLGAVAFGGPWEPSLAIPAALAFLLPTLAGPGLAGRLGGHRLLGGVCLVASVVAAAWWWSR